MSAPDGFAAFGQPVPWPRKSSALAAVRDMVPGVSTEAAMRLIDGVADRIERDDPYDALDFATGECWPDDLGVGRQPHDDPDRLRLDVTGGYRLLAALCTDEPDQEPAGALRE